MLTHHHLDTKSNASADDNAISDDNNHSRRHGATTTPTPTPTPPASARNSLSLMASPLVVPSSPTSTSPKTPVQTAIAQLQAMEKSKAETRARRRAEKLAAKKEEEKKNGRGGNGGFIGRRHRRQPDGRAAARISQREGG